MQVLYLKLRFFQTNVILLENAGFGYFRPTPRNVRCSVADDANVDELDLRALIGKVIVGIEVTPSQGGLTWNRHGSIALKLDSGETVLFENNCGPTHHDLSVEMDGQRIART